MRNAPARHDLLLLDRAGWDAVLRRRPDLAELDTVRGWAERLHPAISRRGQPGDPPDCWPAAIALPPSQGKLRLALTLGPAEVVRIMPPPFLADAITGKLAGRLPAAWIAKATQAAAVGARFAIHPRLFGSAMWQCVTGQQHLAESSDLDLLWALPSALDAAAVLPDYLQALDEVARMDGPRLDGEILFADVGAVQWRELAQARAENELLVKSDTGLALMTRAHILAATARP